MDLKNFSSLLCDNSLKARNLFSYLIGIGEPTEKWGQALLAFYESFSDEIRSDKKAFKQSVIKYFLNYKITKENEYLFKEFSSEIQGENLVRIKNLNHESDLIPKQENKYKTLKSFFQAFKAVKANEMFDFLEQESEVIESFLRKNEKRFIEELNDRYIILFLSKKDFFKTQDFLKKHNLPEDLIYNNRFIGYSGLTELLPLFKDETINEMLRLLNKQNLLKQYSDFINLNDSGSDRDRPDVLDFLFKIKEKNKEDQFTLMKTALFFKPEIEIYLNKLGIIGDIKNANTWDSFAKKFTEMQKIKRISSYDKGKNKLDFINSKNFEEFKILMEKTIEFDILEKDLIELSKQKTTEKKCKI